jgi:holo-[acyl-carrier protein] synthase
VPAATPALGEPMIAGIGTDLCDCRRIEAAIARHGERFALRVLGDEEMTVYRQRLAAHRLRGVRYLATRIAVKEAFSKAIGLGMTGPMSWRHCQALNNEQGRPAISLDGDLAEWFAQRRWQAHVSLTDEGDYAQAFVVIETQPTST